MKRLPLPDLLKGLAVFFMIQVHITELLIDQAGRESMFGKVSLFLGGPFAAVVFMGVMGYFVAKNKDSLSKNLGRGLKIFAYGFLLNIGLNFHLLLKIKFSGWQFNPFEYIFGVDILYLAGISIVILSLLKVLSKGQEWVTAILLLSVAGLTGFMNENLMTANHLYILPFIAGEYTWSYFPLFPWLAYPLAGFIIAQHQQRINLFITQQKSISVALVSVIAALVLLFSRQGIITTINLQAYYHHTFGYVLWALGLSILWMIFIQYLLKLFPGTRAGNFFCRVGKNVTLIYVIQWLIIGNIATAIYQTQTAGNFVYWFTGIFTASVVLAFSIENIKLRIQRFIRKRKLPGSE